MSSKIISRAQCVHPRKKQKRKKRPQPKLLLPCINSFGKRDYRVTSYHPTKGWRNTLAPR